MITIQVDVNEELLQKVGKEAIKDYLQQQINLLKLSILGDEITLAITESNFDMEKELQNAKQEAWDEYKIQYLSNILP